MKNRRLNVLCLFILAVSHNLAGNANPPERALPEVAQSSPPTAFVFVFGPRLIEQFKKNINRSIENDSEVKPYVRTASEAVFDTATQALAREPQPYVGPCYMPRKAREATLRTAVLKDTHHARTLALLLRAFPGIESWSFQWSTASGPKTYRFDRAKVLEKAKSYLLTWSRRMLQGDKLIPGVTPNSAECSGDSQASVKGKQGMEASIVAYSFVSVYELLYPHLTADEAADVLHWIEQLLPEVIQGRKYWTLHASHYPSNFSSHLTFHLLGLASIAAAKGDRTLMTIVFNGGNPDVVDTKYVTSMIEGAVYVESECSGTRYETNPLCLNFKRTFELGTRTNELKRYPAIAKRGCAHKHYYPKHHFPQTGELYDRYRRIDKIKGSCAGKGMYYAINHLKNLTLLTLSGDLNGYAVKNYVGKNGEQLSSSYRFYGNCLAHIHNNRFLVSPTVEACEYYRGNKYPKTLVTSFHLANDLWRLNTPPIKHLLNRPEQALDLLNPLGFAQILGFESDR